MVVGRTGVGGAVGVATVGGNGQREEVSKLIAALTGSALQREIVLIFQESYSLGVCIFGLAR